MHLSIFNQYFIQDMGAKDVFVCIDIIIYLYSSIYILSERTVRLKCLMGMGREMNSLEFSIKGTILNGTFMEFSARERAVIDL